MSFPASATDGELQARLSELLSGGSLEISPREMHRSRDLAALLPANTCVYIPSLPGLPLARTLDAVAALRAAGLDPVPHVSARRILDRQEFRDYLQAAVERYGVHRVLLIGGDEPRAKGPYQDSLQLLEEGVTGFIVDDLNAAVEAVAKVESLDRLLCRRRFEERFSASRMAQDYLDVYRRILHPEISHDGKVGDAAFAGGSNA